MNTTDLTAAVATLEIKREASDRYIHFKTQRRYIEMQEPTFDLEQTILDLVAVVSSLNPLHATPEQQAAMERLRSLVQQLQSPAVVADAEALERKPA
jgi:hypothetical protein